MKIYYHDDPDGRCSAFLVRHFRVPELDPASTITFVPMQYDKKINFSSISVDEEVWIVDFSFEIVDFEKILEKTDNIYWIDHHKSSIKKYSDFLRNHPIMGVRIPDGPAGCQLTWSYFSLENETTTPDFVKYIGDKDTWTFEFGDETRYFNAGILAEGMKPSSDIWYQFWNNPYEFIEQGKIVQKYRERTEEFYIDEDAFDVDWEGFHWCALNTSTKGGEFLQKFRPDYDAYVTFRYSDGLWDIGLYTTAEEVDVSIIAEKFTYNGRRGGGHKGAAGFQCAFPPFLPLPKKQSEEESE